MTQKIPRHHHILPVPWLVLGIVTLALSLAIRVRLLGIPLERDEGEYAYAGQLMLQGIAPYKLAYNMKFPGIYAAYALVMSIFGQTVFGIHLGLLLVNAGTITLIFFLGRRLVNSKTGVAAAAIYAVLSLSPSVLGLAGHATHFVVLPVLGGLLLLLNQSDQHVLKRLFASGLLFGLGLLMKQPGFFFALFGDGYLLAQAIRGGSSLRKILLQNVTFGVGVLLPLGITCLGLCYAGTFGQFWYWTVKYALQYGSLTSLSQGAQNLLHSGGQVIRAGWILWALAGFGLLAGLYHKGTRASTGLVAGLLVSSAFALSAGFYFRVHYFILVLPAISLLGAIAINELSNLAAHRSALAQFVPLLLLGAALGLPFLQEKKIFFEATPAEVCRMIYLENPFPESLRVAEYLRVHTRPDDTIAVIGSEPQIYFYSNRHSATGYIYMYELTEQQPYALRMQRQMFDEISLSRPKYLVFVAVVYSWLWAPQSERSIFTWLNQYAEQNYTLAGLVNIVTPDRTDYYLGEVPEPIPHLNNCILIYERKS